MGASEIKIYPNDPPNGLIQRLIWDGTQYTFKNGTVATAGNRPAGCFRDFVGPNDPGTLMENGDSWTDTTP